MLLGLGLQLLGIGRFIKDFFLANWKWLVPLLILIAGFFYTKNHYYKLGRADEKAAWEARIADEDAKNRKFEAKLADIVSTYGKKAAEEAAERVKNETVYTNKIERIVNNNSIYQECKVDQEVLDSRNAIRELGPK